MKTKPEIMNLLMVAAQSVIPTNVLPMLRDNLDSLQATIDKIMNDDLECKAWTGELNLKIIDHGIFYIDPDGSDTPENLIPGVTDGEPDRVSYYMRFRDLPANNLQGFEQGILIPPPEDLLQYICIILLSDCSGCCNALEYINLNKYGIISTGDVSSTYHS